MADIGLFYGSTSGVTEEIAEKIRDAIGEDRCDLYSMESDYDSVDDLLQYDYLILGCSTWGAGELQNDWREPIFDMEMDKPDFSGKTIALFGPGDCEGHSKHFVGALGILYDQFKALGATIVGAVSAEDYTFEKSTAIRDGKFVGLPLDEVNESEKTDQRIANWLEILKADFPAIAR
ncbi:MULTISPECIES: flavodoxin [Cyanophyceae]|uniref:flavodoxin n=1 Tax=Cyanophyceae TaxID=3028117 RepID=UPI00074D47BE|nr:MULTISPECIES: flavodoxin [Cyanophyceae]MBF2083101.1 flavodoxin [Thermoleptolyngbya sp. C42_A2020_037]BAU44890.1 Flavodoxin [Leptolyngbya sp. O-77]